VTAPPPGPSAAKTHPDVAPLSALLGTWRGTGHGHYPTIADFDYFEEVTFTNPATKPFIAYTQKTRSAEDDRPLHAETGYIRAGADGAWEWVMAQPSGFVEVYAGRLVGTTLSLTSTVVIATPTAKSVTALERTFTWDDNILTYDLSMAAVGHDMQPHLHASLRRVAN
jgi:hypothetical protein